MGFKCGIVGLPNVGKSTLLNRLAGKRMAIVEDVPGVTRDRNYAEVNLDDCRTTLVDTGGLEPETGDELSGTADQPEPSVAEAALQIADPQVRYCGTLGGNLANGDPGNDMPAVMQCLGARYVLRGPNGEREVARATRAGYLGCELADVEARLFD